MTFCVTGKSGLGHLRRVSNVAAAVKRAAPGIDLAIVSNAPLDGLGLEEQALFSRLCVVERQNMARCLADVARGPVVVDTAVIPDLELLPWPLYLILRETVAERLPAFRLPAGRLWEEVSIAAPRQEWTLTAEAIGAKRVSNVGWIYRSAPLSLSHGLLPRRGGERIVLVATGGGGTLETARALVRTLDPVIAHARKLMSDEGIEWRVLQVLGPRAPAGSALTEADATIEVGSQLDRAFAAADVVFSTAGYNSVLELAVTDTPALLCSIPRSYDDQAARAAHWGGLLGLGHRSQEPERSARWLASVLKSGKRRRPAALGPCGSAKVADSLLARIAMPLANRVGAGFAKRYLDFDQAATTCRRANVLFATGVPTVPARVPEASMEAMFARLDGELAVQTWLRTRTTADKLDLAIKLIEPLAALHRSGSQGLGLRVYDEWRRVRPRLAPHSPAAKAIGPARIGAIAACVRDWSVRPPAGARAHGIVHGDFHFGQLLRPKGRDGFVLLDLDDLALGEPEADIGNCVAHIATSPTLHKGPIDVGVVDLLAIFIEAYAAAANARLDVHLVGRYCAAALLRRALKLAEQGKPARIDEILEAAISLRSRDDARGKGAAGASSQSGADTPW